MHDDKNRGSEAKDKKGCTYLWTQQINVHTDRTSPPHQPLPHLLPCIRDRRSPNTTVCSATITTHPTHPTHPGWMILPFSTSSK